MDAVTRKARQDWLALFAEDAIVEDPVGCSPLDPDGRGQHGTEEIAAFWDKTVANAERLEFHITDSFAAGDEVANVGTIVTFLPGDMRMDAEGVFVYRVNDAGKIRSLRAFWEFERAMATARPS